MRTVGHSWIRSRNWDERAKTVIRRESPVLRLSRAGFLSELRLDGAKESVNLTESEKERRIPSDHTGVGHVSPTAHVLTEDVPPIVES